MYSDEEYIQISRDSFKIIRTLACIPCVDLDKDDSIISFGSIKYINNDFIELISSRDSSFYKDISIDESYDANIKDSLTISFIFPFKGKYKIEAGIIGFPYRTTEKNQITIPIFRLYHTNQLTYYIYNLNLKYNGCNGEYLGRIVFSAPRFYKLINDKTNFLQIKIPNLTNSYYAHYPINGEYAKIEKDKIVWRNKEFKKVSENLIAPKIEFGDKAIDDVNGIDIIDKR